MADRDDLVAGRYRLREPVGSGGMGRVWLARDEMLDRDVAVKEFVPPSWMTEEDRDKLRLRTLREARTASRVHHPHVVQIYDVVHADGLPWIVMEYVPSRSLHQLIREDGPVDPPVAARIGLYVLDALTAAHRAGVLHRDVKPHNVLIGDGGRVVLTDFGLATFVDDGGVTGPGLIVGSPQFVSPERARDGASTVEADLWSLGATLYAAVEGRSPYARETSMATLLALATEAPDPPKRAGALRPVLAGLLRHDPAKRLKPDDIAAQLRRVLGGVPAPGARPEPAGDRAAGRVPRQRGRAAVRAVAPIAHETPEPAAELPAGPNHGTLNGTAVAPPMTPPAQAPANGGDPAKNGAATGGGAPRTPGVQPDDEPAPSWPSGPQRTQEPARGRRSVFGLALVVLLVVAAGAAGVLGSRYWRDGDAGAAAPTPAASPGDLVPPVSAAPIEAFSPRVCDAPATGDLPRTPAANAVRTAPNGYRMLPNWSFHTTAEFGVAVPDGWSYRKVGTTWCFKDPDGVRLLTVDPARNAGADPITACVAEERRLTGAGLLPAYRKVEMRPVAYYGKAADWEYTYADAQGTQLHAGVRWFSAGDRAYAVGWVTREFDWTTNRAYLLLVRSSFAPGSA